MTVSATRRAPLNPVWSTVVGTIAVLWLFCAPLFVGLGNSDLANDEAIYSYAVDRILETGEWLTPRLIPYDGPFLEKPPLKFWALAGAMQAGLLPRGEFGLRFLDALFGATAFLYVFWLGRRLAGPVCGVVAVLVLFTHSQLLFEHGLRSNNMEAALFLAYCGGAYHFSRWAEDASRPRRTLHVFAVAAYVTLGFMTKFVAVLFLPLVCVAAVAWRSDSSERLRSGWRDWIVAGARGLCGVGTLVRLRDSADGVGPVDDDVRPACVRAVHRIPRPEPPAAVALLLLGDVGSVHFVGRSVDSRRRHRNAGSAGMDRAAVAREALARVVGPALGPHVIRNLEGLPLRVPVPAADRTRSRGRCQSVVFDSRTRCPAGAFKRRRRTSSCGRSDMAARVQSSHPIHGDRCGGDDPPAIGIFHSRRSRDERSQSHARIARLRDGPAAPTHGDAPLPRLRAAT